LTDFDASGMNIAETVERDLVKHAKPVGVVVQRIAATRKQIEEYGLIAQPVTRSDSRARTFTREYGTQTVELDAIPANAVRRLIRESVERHMDARRLEVLRIAEREARAGLIELFGGAA
jgi:hypothetical protein